MPRTIKPPAPLPPWVQILVAKGVPAPVPEYRFHPVRRWRADWCFEGARLLVEIDGGAWTRGRHTRGRGFIEDIRKSNEAMLLGWRLLRVTPQMVQSGEVVALVLQAMGRDVG